MHGLKKPILQDQRLYTDEIMWVYSPCAGEYNVYVSVKYHPPPEHHPQEGLYSGLHFSLCLCHKGHATWLDGDVVQFPVE